jgi:hypothetical protein
MRAVCIARHRFLSDHICLVFSSLDIECLTAVGFDEGLSVARSERPNLVLCEYDLLLNAPLSKWEEDPALANIPVIAVSLTRRPEEAHAAEGNGIAGFLYLPSLTPDSAWRVLRAATGMPVRAPSRVLSWDAEQPPAPLADRL